MTQNSLKHILNRSVTIMEFSIYIFFFNEGFPYIFLIDKYLILLNEASNEVAANSQ